MIMISLDPEVVSGQLGIIDGQVQRSICGGGVKDLKQRGLTFSLLFIIRLSKYNVY